MHKQRELPNDERPVKGSNGHERMMKRIFEGYQLMPKNGIRFSFGGLCGTRVTRSLASISVCYFHRMSSRL